MSIGWKGNIYRVEGGEEGIYRVEGDEKGEIKRVNIGFHRRV